VTMAAALALPFQTDAGAPVEGRDLIVFIAFMVVLVTVVVQGLTLPALVRKVGLSADDDEEEEEEVLARIAIAEAALARLEELQEEEWTNDDTIERVRRAYDFRQRRFASRIDDREDPGIEERSQRYQKLMLDLYASQRQALTALRHEGRISDEVMRRIQRELDLEEARLDFVREGGDSSN
jgi:hypothetical protein